MHNKPDTISAKTLADMDKSIQNFKMNAVSPAIDLLLNFDTIIKDNHSLRKKDDLLLCYIHL